MHYEFARNSKRCCVSERELRPGELFYSVVIDAPGGIRRQDYAAEHWPGPPEDAIGYWKGRIPVDSNSMKPKTVAIEVMLEQFDKWLDSTDAEDLGKQYVLTLLLIRKKALKLQDMERSEEGEFLIVQRPRQSASYRIRDPRLSPEQVREVEQQLTRLLQTDDDNETRTEP